MNRTKFAFSFACAALLVARPAVGQLVGFPVFAVPSGEAEASTAVAGQFTRGLNAESGEDVGWAGYVSRSMELVSFNVAGGYVMGDVATYTVGAQAAVHLLRNSAENGTVSIQAGAGYLKISDDDPLIPLAAGGITMWKFPIGLAFEARPSDNSRIWMMPRLDLARTSDNAGSATEKSFGLSLGIGVTGGNGFGVHAAFDWVSLETSDPIGAAFGLHYYLGN